MSLGDKINEMCDKRGLRAVDIANMLNLNICTVWNYRTRGFSKINELLMLSHLCGYKVYLYNKELNMKIEITDDDLKE